MDFRDLIINEGIKIGAYFIRNSKPKITTTIPTTKDLEERLKALQTKSSEQFPRPVLGKPVEIPTENKSIETGAKEGTACTLCVPPYSLVITNPAIKPISQISVGDKVFNMNGTYSKVTAIKERDYNGDLVALKIRYQNMPILLTPEHPILVVKAHKCAALNEPCFPGKDNPKCKSCNSQKFEKPEFIPARYLTTEPTHKFTREYILMPRLKKVKDINYIKLSSIAKIGYEDIGDGWIKPRKKYAHNRGRTAIALKDKIAVDTNFMKLVGFYLAEGCASTSHRQYTVTFYFGKHEPNYAEEVKILLKMVSGTTATITETKTSLAVTVSSHLLGHFFANLCGKGALNKHIPQWMLTLPVSKQIPLLEGFWRGDGYWNKGHYNNLSATTVSQQLAYDLRIILHRLGIIHSLYKQKTNKSAIEGRELRGNGFHYHIGVWGPAAIKLSQLLGYPKHEWRFLQSHLAGIDKNFIYIPIRKAERQPYKGIVMNLEVMPTNSYTVDGIIVHNCSDEHFSEVSGALSEALRFARNEGLGSKEVIRRVRHARDELNTMERFDLAAEEIIKLPKDEQEVAHWALPQSRNLRHSINSAQTVEDLEKASAQAANLADTFAEKLIKCRPGVETKEEDKPLPPEIEALKRMVEEKKKGQ